MADLFAVHCELKRFVLRVERSKPGIAGCARDVARRNAARRSAGQTHADCRQRISAAFEQSQSRVQKSTY
jgi:hypothetical protein